IRECVDLISHPDAGKKFGVPRDVLRRATLPELVTQARKNAPLLAKREAFIRRRRTPEDAWITDRIAMLTKCLEQHSGHDSAPLELTYPIATVSFAARPPRLLVHQTGLARDHDVSLLDGAVNNVGHHWLGSRERQRDDRALLACAIDALSD